MANAYWPYFDPEYESLSLRINPPRLYFTSYLHPSNYRIVCALIDPNGFGDPIH